MRKIKICGVKDPQTAYFAALCGADYIGLIQHPASKRYVNVSLGKEIAQAAAEGGARPVAIFVDSSAEEIIQLSQELGITLVQLYRPEIILPDLFEKIIVNRPDLPRRNGRDFLLLDHLEGGLGLQLDWEKIIAPRDAFWFLAGGLTAQNVQTALNQLNPSGVDVSSGVEKEGKKDASLIEEFIAKVRSYD